MTKPEKTFEMNKIVYAKFVLYILIIYSCNDAKEVTQNFESKIIKQDVTTKPQFNVYFLKNKKKVNKIFKDSMYTGVIEYHSLLDSITTQLFDTDKYPQRAIYFYKTQNNYDEIQLDTSSSKKNSFYEVLDAYKGNYQFDTLYPASNVKIPIYNLKFNRTGTNYITGFIEDIAYIQVSDTSKIRIISNHNIISSRVEVIDP